MKVRVAFAIGLILVPTAACGQPASGQSSVARSPESADEVAIYETVLGYWLGKKQEHQLVNEQLKAPPSKDDDEFKECANGLDFGAASRATQHMKALAGVQFQRRGIELIDGSKWTPTDPEIGISQGKTIKAAVTEAFAKSLVSLSQIPFSNDGSDALVKVQLVCGGLCGSGATLHLHKSATQWVVVNRCGEWVS